MEELKFHESVKLLQDYTDDEIIQAKLSALSLLDTLYLERLTVSDEIKRTILHYQTADSVRKNKIGTIDDVLVPLSQRQVQQQLSSFFKLGKTAAIRRVKTLVREKEYLLRARTEHALRVKQIARRLIVIYAEIKQTEEHYDLLIKADHIKRFLAANGLTAASINEVNIDRWGREFTQAGGANFV